MKFPSATLHLLQNIGSCGGPDKGLGIGIVDGQMFFDGLGEFCDATKHSSPKAIDGEVPEEAFHHVQPGGAGGSKVEMKPGIALLPCRHLVMLVGRVVVADDVDFLFGGRASANQVKEPNPFLMAVLVHAASDDVAVGYIHRREERGGSMALVVMGQRLAPPFLERKPRLSCGPTPESDSSHRTRGRWHAREDGGRDPRYRRASPRSACRWKA